VLCSPPPSADQGWTVTTVPRTGDGDDGDAPDSNTCASITPAVVDGMENLDIHGFMRKLRSV
jgi:hypothetical protein